jgi:hypothetical protein
LSISRHLLVHVAQQLHVPGLLRDAATLKDASLGLGHN